MRCSSFPLLLAVSAFPHLLSAQDRPQVPAWDGPQEVLTGAFSAKEWGLPDLGSIRSGRVALVESSGGTRLELRRLSTRAPVSPPPDRRGHTPPFDGNSLLASDFGGGNRNPLGGYFGTFQRSPSVARATVGRVSDERRALVLTCEHQPPGFCGLWIQLYDFDAAPEERANLDARDFSTLSIWVRGRAGGERVLLKVADAAWEQRGDAAPVGELADYLDSGRLSTEWQQAVVPLDRLPGNVRLDLLAQVVFEVQGPGITTLEIGPMAFSLSPNHLPVLPGAGEPAPPSAPLRKATWVWNTAELIEVPGELAALLDFLEREKFDHVFLQLPGVTHQQHEPGELAVDVESMRPLVAAFNGRGIRVYALDGFARYVLPEFHAGVIRTIDHVARYNQTVLPNERFYGVRYDIEPYLLPAFHGPGRSTLLHGLLELTAASVERAHAAGLEYGADIPFWYDAWSEETSEQVTAHFGGTEKPLSEHIIDLVDDVAIMDYRTVAHGADGTIRHGRGELQYAEKQGKAVFVGLETHPVPSEVLLDFSGEPGVGVTGSPHAAGVGVPGFRLPAGVGVPGSPPPGPVVLVGSALDSIFVALVPDPGASAPSWDGLTRWIEGNHLEIDSVRWWPVKKRVDVPAAKITFADLAPADLERVMQDTALEFQRYESFIGFAIHHSESFRALLRESDPDRRE